MGQENVASTEMLRLNGVATLGLEQEDDLVMYISCIG